MWLVVRYQNGCSPEVLAIFHRCCQAMSRVAELSKEFPQDRFYPRLEGNYIRRSIDDIGSGSSWRTKKRKRTRKLNITKLR